MTDFKKHIPFAKPEITEQDIEAVTRVLRSGWLTGGPEVRKFEEEFAEFTGAREAVALNSATAALHLALHIQGIGPGDAVLVPAITFAATATTVMMTGAVPLITDVERTSYLMTPEIAESFITEKCTLNKGNYPVHSKTGLKIRGIVPVHTGGRICDMAGFSAVAERYNLFLSEDAAHAFPGKYADGRFAGNSGHPASFSFYATKNLTTGEGGMLTLQNSETAARLRRIRQHGMIPDTTPGRSWAYRIEEAGFKYNMSDTAAALGREQLKRANAALEHRKKLTFLYRDLLNRTEGILLLPYEQEGESYHLFAVETEADSSSGKTVIRDALMQGLAQRNIGVSLHFTPLYRHGLFQKTGLYHPEEFAVSEEIFSASISLPLSNSLKEEEVVTTADAVKELIHIISK